MGGLRKDESASRPVQLPLLPNRASGDSATVGRERPTLRQRTGEINLLKPSLPLPSLHFFLNAACNDGDGDTTRHDKTCDMTMSGEGAERNGEALPIAASALAPAASK